MGSATLFDHVPTEDSMVK